MTERPVNYILDANWYRDSAVYLELQPRNAFFVLFLLDELTSEKRSKVLHSKKRNYGKLRQ